MYPILEILGKVTLFGGGATAIAYISLKWFGERWFESRFAERLEKFRYEMNSRFNRITKIHEKEFEVLPMAWEMLQEAYGSFANLAQPFQSWPELNHYSSGELEVFLSQCELEDFQKNDLKNAPDKTKYYQDKAYWIRLSRSKKKFHTFRLFLSRNKIFLSRDLFDIFSKIEKALIEAEIYLETPANPDPWRKSPDIFTKLRELVEPLSENLESAIQKRLHFEQS